MAKKSKEIWKDVPGWKGLYQVSSKGRVRSLSRSFMSRSGKNYRVKGKVLQPFEKREKSGDGYLAVHMSHMGRKQTFRIHRLVMLAFCGPSDLEVDHIDRNRHNNKLENLRYVTHAENMQNISASKGEESPQSFLTEKDVCEIRERYKREKSTTMRDLADDYGVSFSHIHSIIHKRSWSHVKC